METTSTPPPHPDWFPTVIPFSYVRKEGNILRCFTAPKKEKKPPVRRGCLGLHSLHMTLPFILIATLTVTSKTDTAILWEYTTTVWAGREDYFHRNMTVEHLPSAVTTWPWVTLAGSVGSSTTRWTCLSKILRISVLWIHIVVIYSITPCSLIGRDQCFGGTYCFHHHSRSTFIPEYTVPYTRRPQCNYLPVWDLFQRNLLVLSSG
jgi:hypothetical protein